MKNHPISRIGFRGDRISILTHDHKHSHECTCVCHIVKINHHSHQPNLFSDFAANFFDFRNILLKWDTWAPMTKRRMSTSVQMTNSSLRKRWLENYLRAREQGLGSSIQKLPIWNKCLHLVKKVTFKVALAVNCPSSSPLTISTTTYVIIATYMVHHLDQPCAWCTPCLSFLANLPAGRAVWPSNRRDPKFLQQSTVFGICVLIQQSWINIKQQLYIYIHIRSSILLEAGWRFLGSSWKGMVWYFVIT